MTKGEYDRIKESGMLYELLPDATGNYETDADAAFLVSRSERFIDPFDSFREHNFEEEDVF